MTQADGGPDFIGIGAQKCGTSWLGWVLSQHPGVLLEKKEIDFFVRNFHRGWRWYDAWFAGRGERKAGEITPNYIYSPREDAARKQYYPAWRPRDAILFWRRRPSALAEIREHCPDVRLFAIFRNPVDRAWSHYWYWRNRKERLGKKGSVRTFRQMFADDGRWIASQGRYGSLLAPWLAAFPQMGVYLYDDIASAPLDLARRLYTQVGVDPAFVPDVARRVNEGRYEAMPPEDRALVARFYREDNERFSELIGRDCRHWLAPDLGG